MSARARRLARQIAERATMLKELLAEKKHDTTLVDQAHELELLAYKLRMVLQAEIGRDNE